MPKKPEINPEDQALFREFLRHVKPLSHTKVVFEPIPPKKRSKKPQEEPPEAIQHIFSDYEKLPPVSGDEILQFSRSGIQNKTLRLLRNGKYKIEAILDLHGMTVIQAQTSLSQFLSHCQKKSLRHVLIIHGKGHNTQTPILKNRLNHWLRDTEQVLAFCSATIKDGRSGALYALLKVS